MSILTSDFDFAYPEELVAHEPLADRDASRMLVRKFSGKIFHQTVSQLPDILPEGSVVIVNDSRVIPARILGEFSTGGKFEILLLSPSKIEAGAGTCVWDAIGKPMRKLVTRQRVYLAEGLTASIVRHPDEPRHIQVTFSLAGTEFSSWLERHGFIPLPPYIKRDEPKPAAFSNDRDRYQTVYANTPGSVAAPTAGLHLTDPIIQRMLDRNITIVPVTLHVGGGTFLPVQTDHIHEHQMHTEFYYLSRDSAEKIMHALNDERPVFAIGTTSFRAIESFWEEYGDNLETLVDATDQWHGTKLFIYPQQPEQLYEPHVFNGIVTNFHQPKSTLYMLICALLGIKQTGEMYKVAMEEKYRLFSYGDTSLLFLE